MGQAHTIGVEGSARELYEATLLGDAADWQRINTEVSYMLAEGIYASHEEHLWLQYILACTLRRTGGDIERVIQRLAALLNEVHGERLHALIVAVTAEQIRAYKQVGNLFSYQLLRINLALETQACEDSICKQQHENATAQPEPDPATHTEVLAT